jgi:hypothetical protein
MEKAINKINISILHICYHNFTVRSNMSHAQMQYEPCLETL